MSMDNGLVFLPVDNLNLKDLHDWAVSIERGKTTKISLSPVTSPRKNGIKVVQNRGDVGCRTRSNEQDLALFRYHDTVFAVKAECPHAGGPLELGDIEEFGDDGPLCVKCPWHGWKIDLQMGNVLEPKGHEQQSTVVYPVMVKEGGRIYIGFNGLNTKYFSQDGMDF